MSKLNLDIVKKYAKPLGRIVASGVVLALASSVSKSTSAGYNNAFADYNDAVAAIMNSDMFSSDKQKAIVALKQYGGSKYYGAVISIVNNSSMFASDKLETIEKLSES